MKKWTRFCLIGDSDLLAKAIFAENNAVIYSNNPLSILINIATDLAAISLLVKQQAYFVTPSSSFDLQVHSSAESLFAELDSVEATATTSIYRDHLLNLCKIIRDYFKELNSQSQCEVREFIYTFISHAISICDASPHVFIEDKSLSCCLTSIHEIDYTCTTFFYFEQKSKLGYWPTPHNLAAFISPRNSWRFIHF